MRKNLILGAVVATAIMAFTASGADAQARRGAAVPAMGPPAAPVPARLGGHPNLNGVWQVMGNDANWDLEPHSAQSGPLGPAGERVLGTWSAEPPGLGVVEGGKIPYKPESLARLQDNHAHRVVHDPEAACYLPGIPRATYIDLPFQIVQGDGDDILMVYEYANANRVIEMKPVEVPPIDTWMGTSYGHWEGDTLVVTTLAQSPGEYKAPAGEMISDAVTWLDRQGNYITNTATVTERFRPMGPNHIDYTATIDDPSVYSHPWSIHLVLYKHVEPNAQLLEFRCVPFSEMLLYGDLLENRGAPAPVGAAPPPPPVRAPAGAPPPAPKTGERG